MYEEGFVIYSPEKALFAMYDYSDNHGWTFTDDVLEAFSSPNKDDAEKWIHGWSLPTGRVVRPADKQLKGCVVLKCKIAIEVEGL
ncbi:hypothetical protein KNT87_gp165 [Erwinia phage Cronus]|uniref:Uncharacterized protein n=1 Tax=Erwinia phage Cronus TaxID=2163633 RepID=A0A2S1GM09_9CAUD|nr:hypothetical protein KNT87_gp165 [Erwinia phage Cronus]AWD90404.1 hypothetical protein [Erwinia phage Cronus]